MTYNAASWIQTAVRLPHPAWRWPQVWYGKLLRAEQAARRRSLRSFEAGDGGGGARTNTLGAPAMAKLTKFLLQVKLKQVEPLVPTLLKEKKHFRFWRPHAQCSGAEEKMFVISHRQKHRSSRVVFTCFQFVPGSCFWLKWNSSTRLWQKLPQGGLRTAAVVPAVVAHSPERFTRKYTRKYPVAGTGYTSPSFYSLDAMYRYCCKPGIYTIYYI